MSRRGVPETPDVGHVGCIPCIPCIGGLFALSGGVVLSGIVVSMIDWGFAPCALGVLQASRKRNAGMIDGSSRLLRKWNARRGGVIPEAADKRRRRHSALGIISPIEFQDRITQPGQAA